MSARRTSRNLPRRLHSAEQLRVEVEHLRLLVGELISLEHELRQYVTELARAHELLSTSLLDRAPVLRN
jgi:hypothetical protein